MSAVILGAIVSAVFTLIVRSNRRIERQQCAAGKCPSCMGFGADWVMQNGLNGCLDCNNTGTLEAHNKVRAAYGMRPLVVK